MQKQVSKSLVLFICLSSHVICVKIGPIITGLGLASIRHLDSTSQSHLSQKHNSDYSLIQNQSIVKSKQIKEMALTSPVKYIYTNV